MACRLLVRQALILASPPSAPPNDPREPCHALAFLLPDAPVIGCLEDSSTFCRPSPRVLVVPLAVEKALSMEEHGTRGQAVSTFPINDCFGDGLCLEIETVDRAGQGPTGLCRHGKHKCGYTSDKQQGHQPPAFTTRSTPTTSLYLAVKGHAVMVFGRP
ncbi:uncharacterized protein LY79DRAFT_128972 [Colletotrichum navitas]|uniref:Uncharacterized protein n=1 Tax=Colletotrichum navitas TaxID=681940 RepID=A0AAD8Q473_9PEZI|nr:uncharacterized protein LY79DRAFT_128972 [Colletotrichum navitas]KAK1594881.1 hypothetical protein LY79DRAFT_128972 [Colletotrichum navitas]